eukprot:CAMPEP_0202896114 /NCGR_PEP_ID=MMETSP1392-20130828/5176_1 /ASSEMBLY_ACC=CAM_ASM_000868 /TAXON_ID=225041 /ORGANISM="Chlamydomonas chlamydogama, Strain SAG 11-48b" /LENGTH=200 /DNA_ID=CAMNT_0049581353 /DNA_START=80 /DNA_END=682 /DNA_ORIENTATION=-
MAMFITSQLARGPFDVASKVGLQILLEPQASSVIFRAACGTAGIIYPVYCSFRALENNDPKAKANRDDDEQWLTYWAMYGLFTLVEHTTDNILKHIPYYYHLKFGFLVWLMAPNTKGAHVLYQKAVRPVLRRFQPKLDIIESKVATFAGGVYSVYKVPIDAAVGVVSYGLSQASSGVKWFLSNDAGSADGKTKTQFIKGA